MNPGALQAGDGADCLPRLPAFSHAFQPIVDTLARRVVSHEALVRGPSQEPAHSILAQVQAPQIHRFDGAIREAAIARAVVLGVRGRLNLNCLPQGLCAFPWLLDATLAQAVRHGLSPDRIVLEVTESEVISDHEAFAKLMNVHRARGVRVAIDDFGAGYSGLNLLAGFQPDEVKIDMNLVRGIEGDGPRQAVVRAILQVCEDLAIDVVAEGVETLEEHDWLREHGVRLFQGYLLARPMFEGLPDVTYP